MPYPPIPMPDFPDVPSVPGVPSVARPIASLLGLPVPRVRIDQAQLPEPTKQVWGVFDATGKLIAQADTFMGMEYRSESRISDYPQEAGAFASYNKVDVPFDVRVQLAKGGTEKDRTDFMDALNAAKASLDLFSVVTPEKTFVGVNLTGISVRRDAYQGANVLVVDMSLREVRITGKATGSNTKAKSGASPVNGGAISTQTPTAAQAAATKVH